jgi:hypothetical protein
MPKTHIRSNKISGNHSTFIEAAIPLIKKVVQYSHIRRVTPGIIKSGLATLRKFPAAIKMTPGDKYIKLVVRAKISIQEIHIYTTDTAALQQLIAHAAREEGYHIQH